MAGDIDDAEVERRWATESKVLREYWRKRGWKPFSPEEFYVTWPNLAEYAWRLLVCNLVGHKWHDSHFILYGEPGDSRTCDRCDRNEELKEGA